jgi:hypothetical protein
MAEFARCFAIGLWCYSITSVIVVLGVVLGIDHVLTQDFRTSESAGYVRGFIRRDGLSYLEITKNGYCYKPEQMSSVAFFPAFPLLARCVTFVTGLRPDVALVLIANVSLACTFVLLMAYLRDRYKNGHPALPSYTLLTFGLWPPTFFFRMAYSESLFLLLTAVFLYGIQRRWSLLVLAAIVGCTTATRPVGVALLVPLMAYAWRWMGGTWQFVLRMAYILPVACSGIAAYMVFQLLTFDQPLAFALTQSYYRLRLEPPLTSTDKLLALLSLEPFVSVYDYSSPCYWEKLDANGNLVFNLQAANPFYFGAAILAVGIGIRLRWLTSYEFLLGCSLLVIPYVTRSCEMCMGSFARFAAVSIPTYIVLGNILIRLPHMVSAAFFALIGFLLGIYAAFFASGHNFF